MHTRKVYKVSLFQTLWYVMPGIVVSNDVANLYKCTSIKSVISDIDSLEGTSFVKTIELINFLIYIYVGHTLYNWSMIYIFLDKYGVYINSIYIKKLILTSIINHSHI